jgi:hypothetical protein
VGPEEMNMEINGIEDYWFKREAICRSQFREAQLKVNPPISNADMLRMEEENTKRIKAQEALEKTFRWRIKEWWDTHRPHLVWGRYWEGWD